MPNQVAEFYASQPELIVLGGLAALALLGACLLLQRILVAVRRRATIEEGSSDADEDRWVWEHPFDPVLEPPSSQPAVTTVTAHLNALPAQSGRARSTALMEYFDPLSDAFEDTPTALAGASAAASNTSQPSRVALSVADIAGHAYRSAAAGLAAMVEGAGRLLEELASAELRRGIWVAARDRLHATASARSGVRPGNPAHRDLEVAAKAVRPRLGQDLMRTTASGDRGGRPPGLVPFGLVGVATICMVVALGYASNGREPADPAFSDRHDHESHDVAGAVDPLATAALAPSGPPAAKAPANAEGSAGDQADARAQVETARAQAAAAKRLAGREHKAAEVERSRSTSLRQALLESRRQTDALRTSLAAADKAREERVRNELAAARTLDALGRIAADARTLLGKTTSALMAGETSPARQERQRGDGLARDLSEARASVAQIEAEAAADRNRANVTLRQATRDLAAERRKSERLRADLAAAESSNAALAARADAAEQERAGAVSAKEQAEQRAAEMERAMAQERAAAASARGDLDESGQALAAERAAAASARDDLDHARRERDAARALSVQVWSGLQQALDSQREAAVALARDLAAARDDNDRLKAEQRMAAIEPRAKHSSPRATTGSGAVKPVSLKGEHSEIRKQGNASRSLRRFTLPYALLPRRPALE